MSAVAAAIPPYALRATELIELFRSFRTLCSCDTFTPSVGLMPGATFVRRRSLPADPIDTVFGSSAIEPLPSATEFGALATAPWPSAVAPAPDAADFAPIAVAPTAAAAAPLPSAIALAPAAVAFVPIATALTPVAPSLL
ncbi:hypothetical protein DB771_09600 [Burkholderia sp. AU29985]|nr:hypothetical protein EGY28_11980 [Burkholderia dolosa]PRE54417.1 hypothetical protein C6P87_06165 [Burkholderia sp. AU12872]PUA77139.1 hypothetical protein DB771_09600 [Burkholderia sp. AU29985]VWB25893.1 hypothetical protein BDO18943_01055 [Burkholderia dolosa]